MTSSESSTAVAFHAKGSVASAARQYRDLEPMPAITVAVHAERTAWRMSMSGRSPAAHDAQPGVRHLPVVATHGHGSAVRALAGALA